MLPTFLGPFMEALPEEVIATHSTVDFVDFPRLFGDRCHAYQAGQVAGALPLALF